MAQPKPDAPARAVAPATSQPQPPPLAAGKAAGIKEAQGAGVWNYVPFAIVGGLALIVVLSGNDNNNAVVVTTTSTGN